jgi:hypothetical protein
VSAGASMTRRAQRLGQNLIEDAEQLVLDLQRFIRSAEQDSFLGTKQLVQAAVELDRQAQYLVGLREGLEADR